MRAAFNLVEEPWIPVIWQDGRTQEMGLRETLKEAPNLRAIRDPMPTVEFGLYRLLVALVMDIFELPNTDILRLGDLLSIGCFEPSQTENYFTRWQDRFDLFHPKYPFLQTTGMDNEPAKPLASLLPAIASGTNTIHFHHAHEADFAVCPPVAARLLAGIAPFMTAGGAGLSPSINGAPPWYELIVSDSLFKTICLNCCVLPLPQATGTAQPAWRDDRAMARERYTEVSLLEALTWRPRRIQFLAGPAGECALSGHNASVLISTMKFSAGASCNFSWRDPNVPYRIASSGARVMRPQEGREIWRDTGPLALLQDKDYRPEDGSAQVRFERPAVVSQFALMVQDRVLKRDAYFQLALYGMRTDLKMKVFEWYREDLSLPAPLIWRGVFHLDAQRAMDQADQVAYYLKQAIRKVYPREGKSNDTAFRSLIAGAQRNFWQMLRSHYDLLLRRLASLPEENVEDALAECLTQWESSLWGFGIRSLEAAIGDMDTAADILERQVKASSWFRNCLSNLLSYRTA